MDVELFPNEATQVVGNLPEMKLHYFGNCAARGELIRLAAALYGLPISQNLFDFETWLKTLKSKTPYHKVPCMEVNGKFFGESFAVFKYLTTISGAYPADSPLKTLELDGVLCFVEYAMNEFYNAFEGRFVKSLNENLKIMEIPFTAEEEKYFNETLQTTLQTMNERLEINNGRAVSFSQDIGAGEIAYFYMIDAINTCFTGMVSFDKKYPMVYQLWENVRQNDRIANYMSKRPVSKF